MARAVRKCVVCRKLFAANARRKTCSDECHSELAIANGKSLHTRMNSEPNGKVVKTKNKSYDHWEPSPEYIQEQCRLIRAGLLVIKDDWVERIEPLS